MSPALPAAGGVRMAWYSSHGTGATLHGIEPTWDGRVRFTSWLTLFWLPLVPLRSWSGRYVGREASRALGLAASPFFVDLRREPHDWGRILTTFAWGVTGLLVAAGPAAALIAWTSHRAATPLELVLVFASVLWFVAVLLWCEREAERKLESAAVVLEDVAAVEMAPPAAPSEPGTPVLPEAPRPDLKWHQRDLSPRGIGVLLVAGGLGLTWLGIVSPLTAAMRHAESVSLSFTMSVLAPFTLGAGTLYLALGERARALLRPHEGPALPRRLMVGALVAAGLLTHWWLRSRLRALGYAA